MSQKPPNTGKDVLFRRMLMAVVSSIIVQCLLMSLVVLLTHLSPTRPLSWLEESLSLVTSLSTWCYFLILSAVIVLQGVVCSKSYLTSPPLLDTRFAVLCSVFTPHNLTVVSLHLTIGAILVWLHLSFEGSLSLSKKCETLAGNCLREDYVYLLLSGVFTGAHHFLRSSFFETRHLEFPVIPQGKFTQVRREMSRLIPRVMTTAVWPVMYFLGLYYSFGGCVRGVVAPVLFLSVEDEPLDRVSRLVDVQLMFRVWLYSGFFSLTMESMHLLFQVHLTEWMEFDVGQRVYEERASMSLGEALALEEVPIMQQLGFLDLVTLAQKQKSRRGIIFSLSQPGGHPYNWNCIVDRCLGVARGFAKRVEEVCAAKQEVVVPLKPVAATLERPYAFHMRNLARVESPERARGSCPQPLPSTGQLILEFVKSRRQRIVDYVMSKPLVFYFFGVRSDSKIRHLLVTGQSVIWAVEAISSLAVISLREDSYGIVQKDLPGMIEALLGLKQALDKLHKMSLLSRKPQQDDREIRYLLGALRSADKRGIYRIVVAFREYFEDLALDQGVRDQLQGFFSFRE
ncbi:nucleoporin NDC1 [Diachasma alloeum]|uniref:nucleoporin NDC1 n=1 Tax=Diachasma alloeum TaxID=454923 RepID=UPI000738242B|nr:nucleoporin NDC1 [Diachasma alloeum]